MDTSSATDPLATTDNQVSTNDQSEERERIPACAAASKSMGIDDDEYLKDTEDIPYEDPKKMAEYMKGRKTYNPTNGEISRWEDMENGKKMDDPSHVKPPGKPDDDGDAGAEPAQARLIESAK